MIGLKNMNNIYNNIVIGNGFIGSHLIKSLDNPCVLELKEGIDAIDFLPLAKDVEVVYHLGAHLRPKDDRDIQLHRAVHDYCQRTGAYLVYTSSAAIYDPTTLYAVQKLYGEIVLRDIPHTFLRLFNVYGEFGSGIVDKIKRKEFFKINGTGTQKRDFVHVEDVVEAICIAGEEKIRGTFDIGTGKSISVNELLEFAELEREYVNMDSGVKDSVAKVNPRLGWESYHDVVNYVQA